MACDHSQGEYEGGLDSQREYRDDRGKPMRAVSHYNLSTNFETKLWRSAIGLHSKWGTADADELASARPAGGCVRITDASVELDAWLWSPLAKRGSVTYSVSYALEDTIGTTGVCRVQGRANVRVIGLCSRATLRDEVSKTILAKVAGTVEDYCSK